jgi:hypothetical protein
MTVGNAKVAVHCQCSSKRRFFFFAVSLWAALMLTDVYIVRVIRPSASAEARALQHCEHHFLWFLCSR